MILRGALVFYTLILCSCAATKPAPEIPLDAVPARLEPEPAKPVQIVEIHKPIPFPNQLKPLPHLSLPALSVPPDQSIQEAHKAARIEPSPSGFLNAVQVWPYTEGALYQVYTTPGKITDIALQPGEELIDISSPDSVRWIIGDTRSGSGDEERTHIVIKPTRADLQTSLAIFTSRRTYHLEVRSTPETWMAAVSWQYPQDNLLAIKSANRARESAAPVASGLKLEQLKFRYTITGDKPSWRPVRAFDDGMKVYIQFPEGIAQGEMPPLFVIGPAGEAELVNYRVRTPYYIVDRLFGAVELRLGGKEAQKVRITRTDGAKSTRRARR